MGLDGMSAAEAQAALLPSTNTWILDGAPMDAVSLFHPIENGVPNPSKSTTHMVKVLLLTTLKVRPRGPH